jgi:CHRD domain
MLMKSKSFTLALLAVVVVAGLLALNVAPSLANGGRPLATDLTGASEVPGPGDPDGSGSAQLTLNQGQGEICYELSVSGIAPATAAHIHIAPAGVAGPVVVGLAPPTSGSSSGCATVDPELIKAIRQNPENYYVNVHNVDFPRGAVRGQLGK